MTPGTIILVTTFLAIGSLVLLVLVLVQGRRGRLEVRLESLSASGNADADQAKVAPMAHKVLPRIGAPLIPANPEQWNQLQSRLIHAGLYGRQAMSVFLGVKMLLMFVPIGLGLLAGLGGVIEIEYGLLLGIISSAVGLVGPSFWLDRRKKFRQNSFRRALPDAMDVLVICLEGGLSLPAALRRVAGELRIPHPLLAAEMNILLREMQLGLSAGESLRQFADRADLEELRTLATVVLQCERLGAGLVQSLRVHAESLRFKRLQLAEEMAQKASVKILFPTLLFIFPGVFIIILGPAVVRIIELFTQMKR